MFLPVRDINPTRSASVVNYLLIVANVLAWLWQSALHATGAAWLELGYTVIPIRLVGDPLGEVFTIFSSMFMHGSWVHLGGNLLYLYIFGDNVEDALGHWRYLLFYLLSGVIAALAQVGVDPASQIPMVGASGAIAGVLGGYIVLHPRAPIVVLNLFPPLWLLIGFLPLFPAWVTIGIWFLWNLLGGLGSLGAGGGDGGIAFFSHIGGFVAGLVLIRPSLAGRSPLAAERWEGWRPPARRPRRRLQRPGEEHPDPWYPPDQYH